METLVRVLCTRSISLPRTCSFCGWHCSCGRSWRCAFGALALLTWEGGLMLYFFLARLKTLTKCFFLLLECHVARCVQMDELQARDLRAWCPLMHAAWSGSAEVFRAVVVAIEDNLGRDQVRSYWLSVVLALFAFAFALCVCCSCCCVLWLTPLVVRPCFVASMSPVLCLLERGWRRRNGKALAPHDTPVCMESSLFCCPPQVAEQLASTAKYGWTPLHAAARGNAEAMGAVMNSLVNYMEADEVRVWRSRAVSTWTLEHTPHKAVSYSGFCFDERFSPKFSFQNYVPR